MRREFWIGIAISIVFFGLFIYYLYPHLDSLANALSDAQYYWLLPAISANILAFYFRAERWKILLKHIKKIRIPPLFRSILIGFMASNILPVRIGEFVRAYIIGRRERISKSAAFSTIVVERVFDIFCVLLMLVFVSIIYFPKITGQNAIETKNKLVIVGFIGLALSLAIIIFLILIREKRDLALKVVNIFLSPLPSRWATKILDIFDNFASSIRFFNSAWDLARIMFWSIIMWSIFGFNIYFVFIAFHRYEISFVAALFMVVILALAVAIPAAPGFVGTFHAAALMGIMAVDPGIDPGTAGGISLILHLNGFIPVTVIGLIFLPIEQLTLRDIQMQSDSMDDDNSAA